MSNAEWLKARMAEHNLTVADVARLAKLPVRVIERALAGDSDLLTDLTLSVALDSHLLKEPA